MKKRDLSGLSETHLWRIEQWLKPQLAFPSSETCPFFSDNKGVPRASDPGWDDCNFCNPLFPKKAKNFCPCRAFGMSYVRRVAREILHQRKTELFEEKYRVK